MGWRDWLWWTLVILGTAPIWGTLIWHEYELLIRPMLIPAKEIEELVTEMRRRSPADPAEAAFIEEQAAWYRSETFEQGKWRRIRKRLARND